MHDVLHIPSLKCNLLLVNKLAQYSNVIVQFNSDHYLLQDQWSKTIPEIDRLWYLSLVYH